MSSLISANKMSNLKLLPLYTVWFFCVYLIIDTFCQITRGAICHFCYRQQLEGRNESLKRGSQTTWSWTQTKKSSTAFSTKELLQPSTNIYFFSIENISNCFTAVSNKSGIYRIFFMNVFYLFIGIFHGSISLGFPNNESK